MFITVDSLAINLGPLNGLFLRKVNSLDIYIVMILRATLASKLSVTNFQADQPS